MRSPRIIAIGLLVSAGGCDSASRFYAHLTGADQPRQVTPDQFTQRPSSITGADNPNATPQLQPVPAPQPAPTPAAAPTRTGQTTPIDPAVASVVEQHSASTQPAAGPTTVPAGEASLASGQYMTLGGVIAEVNGTPIYVNKVLQLVWPTLHNDARTMDARHFAYAAEDEINREIDVLESDELFYAAAEQALDATDKRRVDDLTTVYHQQLVTQAGGSLEVARRRAAANGDDFDQLVRDQYRRYMTELYQERRFAPFAEPSAQEMRAYYNQHRNEPFITEHAEATFDMLAIDPAQMNADSPEKDRQLAFDQAKQAHDRAVKGEDFATLFKEYNNDAGLISLTSGTGAMGTFQRGSFNKEQIEDAIWDLQPGQVTDVIEVNGVLYIAKLESRKAGLVKPFEDENVQAKISGDLRRQRFGELYEEDRKRLFSEAITRTYRDMVATAVEMALQSYQVWSTQK